MIASKLTKFFSMTILLNHQYILINFFSFEVLDSVVSLRWNLRTLSCLRKDGSRRLNFSSLQKITTALRILAYGVTTDFMDEYIKIGGVTTMESLKIFIKAVVLVLSIGRVLKVT